MSNMKYNIKNNSSADFSQDAHKSLQNPLRSFGILLGNPLSPAEPLNMKYKYKTIK